MRGRALNIHVLWSVGSLQLRGNALPSHQGLRSVHVSKSAANVAITLPDETRFGTSERNGTRGQVQFNSGKIFSIQFTEL